MGTRNDLHIDNMVKRIDEIHILSSKDLARTLSLYQQIDKNQGVLTRLSANYIDTYTGSRFYKRYSRHLDMMYDLMVKNGLTEDEIRIVVKRVARRCPNIPTHVKAMKVIYSVSVEETYAVLKAKNSANKKQMLLDRFKLAIKKYLNLTYRLGYSEPSECGRSLAGNHRIVKYIMSGEFSLILLPFLPELEDQIKKAYEHYELTEDWESLKGSYYNNINQYRILAIEIKKLFVKGIPNFAQYIDDIYINTYRTLMLKERAAQAK